MSGERWIEVVDWDRHQHRDMARTTVPPWIKVATRLLSDDAYLELSPNRRAMLLGLWLEYARTRRALRENTASISRRLAQRVTSADLEALNRAGFIVFSASNPASKSAGLEVEVEREGLRKGQSRAPTRAPERPPAHARPNAGAYTPNSNGNLERHNPAAALNLARQLAGQPPPQEDDEP